MADKKNNRRNNRNNDDDFNPKFKKRRATGACAKHQRDITLAVKRCRQIALLPYTQD